MKKNIEKAFEIVNNDYDLEMDLVNSGNFNLIIAYLVIHTTSFQDPDVVITDLALAEGNEEFLENLVKVRFEYWGDKKEEVRKKLSGRSIEIFNDDGITDEEEAQLQAICENLSDEDAAALKEILGDQWPDEDEDEDENQDQKELDIDAVFEIVNDDQDLELELVSSGNFNLIIAYLIAWETSYSSTDRAITDLIFAESNEEFLENLVKTGFDSFGDLATEVRERLSARGVEIIDGNDLTEEEQTKLDAIRENLSDEDIATLKKILGDQWPEEEE